jgi:protein required for attachment to host cells
MSITWIVVANARHAHIFSHSGPNQALKLMQESVLTMEENNPLQSNGRASPRKGHADRQAAQGFAHRVADQLRGGRSRGQFSRAILVAPPTFMGLLNAELDAGTAALVAGRLDKDYTRKEADMLRPHLEKCLCV